MDPPSDHGEKTYKGSGRLEGKAALITGGDSGIGRAVAIAFAREGADVAIAYLNEDDDARETAALVEKAGRKAVTIPGDLTHRACPAGLHRGPLLAVIREGWGVPSECARRFLLLSKNVPSAPPHHPSASASCCYLDARSPSPHLPRYWALLRPHRGGNNIQSFGTAGARGASCCYPSEA